MLYVFFGLIDRDTSPSHYVFDIDSYFNGFYEDSWIDDWAVRVIREIDDTEVISPKLINSPIFELVSMEWISGGAKQLIMMNSVDGVVYDGDNFGDNCWKLLLELSRTRDIAISLSYYPQFEWLDGVVIYCLNTKHLMPNREEFRREHRVSHDPEVDFADVDWVMPLNSKVFVDNESERLLKELQDEFKNRQG